MAIDDELKKLMQEGWNLQIECKAVDRVYGMTYEVRGSNYTAGEEGFIFPANTLEELVEELKKRCN